MQFSKSLKLIIFLFLLVITVIFTGCGGTVPPIDNNSEDTSGDYYQGTIEVFNLSVQKLNELIQAPPSDVETCLEILGDYLIEQSDVESYEVFGDSLKVIFDSGSYSTITLIDLDSSDPIASGGVNNLDNNNILKQTERLSSNPISNNKKTTGKNVTTFESIKKDNYFIKSCNKEDVEYIGNHSVIIWAPFETYFTQYGNSSVSEYAEILNESGQYFNITLYTNHEADIEALKTITDYGIVILDSHGSLGRAIITGEVPDEFNTVTYAQELQPPDQVMFIDKKVGVSYKDKKVEQYEERYIVTADWFGETLNENFPNSIIFNSSCESAIQPCYLDLCFRLRGAATYYGNSADATNSFGHARVKETLEGLVNGKTTGEAYEEESETFWHWEAWHLPVKVTNIWKIYGKKNVKIPVSNDEDDTNHPPEIVSTPVTSATKDEPYSYDVNATDSDGDTLTYSLNVKPTGMTINSSTGLISWTPTSEGNYNVTVEASDGELFDTQSFTINVDNDESSTLSAPSIIIASQGTSDWNIFVSWSRVTGATHYQLYRATSEMGTKTAIENWTYNFYTDIDVSPGVHYFYFVKAATDSIGSNASAYSDCAEGWKAGSNLVIPTIYDPGSSVNSGTPYTVSWSDESADGAEKYRIFEIESTAISGTTYIVYGTSMEFNHIVNEDTTYLYKVCGYCNGGWSDYSDQVDMVVKAEAEEMFPAPTLYPIQLEDYVEVGYPETTKFMIFTLSWSNVVGADIYNIEWAIDSSNPSNFDTHNPNHDDSWPNLLSETIAREMDSSSHIFYWRVRAESFPSGKIGYWSNIRSIYCPSIDEVFGTGD